MIVYVVYLFDATHGYEFFTVRMHHGGKYVESKDSFMHLCGQIDHINYCNPGYMSLIYLREMTNELGYNDMVVFHHKFIGVKPHNDFIYLACDDICYRMAIDVPSDRMVNVYAKHVEYVQHYRWK